MTKKDLIEKVAEASQVTKKDAAKVVDAFLQEVGKALQSGEQISFTGFGTFKVVARSEREARNPKTGEKIKVPACRVPKFIPGKGLRAALA